MTPPVYILLDSRQCGSGEPFDEPLTTGQDKKRGYYGCFIKLAFVRKPFSFEREKRSKPCRSSNAGHFVGCLDTKFFKLIEHYIFCEQ